MTEPVFDAEGLFGDDYLYFFAGPLEERGDAETELLWQLLDLRPGMAVLDLACGHGRIANRLAQRGCVVTGLDATPLFLEHARRDAAARGVAVDYLHGDMRELPWQGRFDRVISWFSAFGYFSDDGNRQVLAQAAAALRPGGRLAVEMNNYPSLMRRYQDVTVTERNGDLLIDQHRLDPLTGRSDAVWTFVRDGAVRRVPFSVRLFTFPELRDWLLAAGFATVDGYGEDGQPLTAASRRMITVACR
ncbi:MAG: SAM-dependent methyltransferase [Gemmatimonadota bacterium]